MAGLELKIEIVGGGLGNFIVTSWKGYIVTKLIGLMELIG